MLPLPLPRSHSQPQNSALFPTLSLCLPLPLYLCTSLSLSHSLFACVFAGFFHMQNGKVTEPKNGKTARGSLEKKNIENCCLLFGAKR